MKKHLLLLTFGITISAYSQTTVWEKSIGTVEAEGGASIIQPNANTYVLVGQYNNGTNYDFNLIKTDTSGNVIWNYPYNSGIGTNQDQGYDVTMAHDSGYVMAGFINVVAGTNTDMFAIKTDKDGSFLWQKKIGGNKKEVAFSITSTQDSGFVMAGSTTTYGKGLKDFYVVKLNKDGDSLWAKTYGASSNDEVYSVRSAKDGGFFVTGYYATSGYKIGVLLKLDANGDSLWSKQFNFNPADASVYDAVEDVNTGMIYITGSFYGDTGSGTKDHVLIAKVSPTGVLIGTASKILPSISTIRGVSITMGNNSLAITGLSGADVLVIRTDTNTTKLIDYYYGASTGLNETGAAIIQDANGDFVILGSDAVNSGNFYLIKFFDCYDLTATANAAVNSGTLVDFTSAVAGNHGGIDVYAWSGDDGFSSSSPNPSYTYSTTGSFNYSLVYTDSRGCSKTINSSVNLVGIDEKVSANTFRIFPNPSSTRVNIENNSNTTIIEIGIYNILGDEVVRVANTSKAIDVSTLPSGVYFLKLQTEMGDVTKKIIRE